MAAVVTIAGSVTCGHPASQPPPEHGRAALSGAGRLTVDGKPVLLFSSAAGLGPYTGCSYDDGTLKGPCARTTVLGGGSSAKLTVGGAPVLLVSLDAISGEPPPPAPVTVSAGQSKLTAS